MDRKSIIKLPNPNLRKSSQKVAIIDDKVLDLVSDMRKAAVDWEKHRNHEITVGLAAIQVDVALNIFLAREEHGKGSKPTYAAFINPKIVKKIGKPVLMQEGCLSVPGFYGMVPRYEEVKIQATDENGQGFTVRGKGIFAQIFQHELDHLKGKMFVDIIEDDQNAFLKHNEDGSLTKADYTEVKKSGILR